MFYCLEHDSSWGFWIYEYKRDWGSTAKGSCWRTISKKKKLEYSQINWFTFIITVWVLKIVLEYHTNVLVLVLSTTAEWRYLYSYSFLNFCKYLECTQVLLKVLRPCHCTSATHNYKFRLQSTILQSQWPLYTTFKMFKPCVLSSRCTKRQELDSNSTVASTVTSVGEYCRFLSSGSVRQTYRIAGIFRWVQIFVSFVSYYFVWKF